MNLSKPRTVVPETLDHLSATDPRAVRSRADLRRINRLMGASSLLAHAVRHAIPPPRSIVEIGAGDGTLMLALARRLAADWPAVRLTLLDRQMLVSDQTMNAFDRLGWSADVLTMDVEHWLRENMVDQVREECGAKNVRKDVEKPARNEGRGNMKEKDWQNVRDDVRQDVRQDVRDEMLDEIVSSGRQRSPIAQHYPAPDTAPDNSTRGDSVARHSALDAHSQHRPRHDLILANLFMHHFDDVRLRTLLRAIAARTDAFVACEPHRHWLALSGSRLVGLIGANEVTREDAVLSVRAGFRGRELSALWPTKPEWSLTETRQGLFSHCFQAVRHPEQAAS